mmetsp:Transcript_11719/g.21322  ORF Transcript_11719/g.21322 Transcript_11719/m.21322 type:complete len:218 (+) Transcript_11719:768-1421(+)
MVFTILSRIVLSSASMLVGLECPSVMSGQVRAIFAVRMVPVTVLCPCSVSSITRPVMSIRAEERGRAVLQLTLSHGMRTCLNFWICVRIMEMRWIAPVTYFTLCGFPTFLWSVSTRMEIGPSCVQMNAPVCQIAMAMSSMSYTRSTNGRARVAKRSKLRSSGLLFWIHRRRQEHLICSSRTRVTRSPTRKTLEPSSAPIYAQKLWNTRHLTKLPCAI